MATMYDTHPFVIAIGDDVIARYHITKSNVYDMLSELEVRASLHAKLRGVAVAGHFQYADPKSPLIVAYPDGTYSFSPN